MYFVLTYSSVDTDDYLAIDTQITFESQPDGQSSALCTDVTIVDDAILEADEILRIEVESSSPVVSPDPSANSATIEIIDNDRMA